MTIDMTFERREELIRRDEHAAGREEGLAQGREELMKVLLDLYRDGIITMDVIKSKTEKSDAQIEAALANLK